MMRRSVFKRMTNVPNIYGINSANLRFVHSKTYADMCDNRATAISALDEDIRKFIDTRMNMDDIESVDMRVVVDQNIRKLIKIQERYPDGKIRDVIVDENATKIIEPHRKSWLEKVGLCWIIMVGVTILIPTAGF